MATSAEPVDELGALWAWFVPFFEGYSPIYGAVSETVARDAELLALIREAPPSGHQPTSLLAAVHYLVLEGLDHPLADVYAGGSDADPGPLFREVCLEHRAAVIDLLATRRVQTNEVGRSALIGPALTWADRDGEGLQLVDVGCSAGLNLLCDRYLLDYGGRGRTGPADAAVRIPCEVLGGAPPIAPRLPELHHRVGIDIDPPDLADPNDARWLLACVWPDTGRLPRTEAAIRLAREDPPPVLHGDALATLPTVLDDLGPGRVCILTTWSFSYLLVEDRARFVELLTAAGRRRPITWIAGDGSGVVDVVDAGPPPTDGRGAADVLSAVTFDGGTPRPGVLAFVQSHGAWIDWLA